MKLFILPIAAGCLSGVVCQKSSPPVFYPCPFLGPSYFKPASLAGDPTVKGALDNITATIEAGLTSGLLENQSTAISLAAFSTSDDEAAPFYSFHWTPPSLAEIGLGVENITGDSVYRIGSVSKVLTVYTLLVANGFKQWQSPITDFVPELRMNDASNELIDTPVWEDVTLESLASHLGGIGVEYGFVDLAQPSFPYTDIGLPEVPDTPCGNPIGSSLCTREQTLYGLKNRSAVFPAYSSPSYSNVAFQLLSYAIESITGDSFSSVLQSQVYDALNMSHSFYDKPDDAIGVIPTDSPDLWWNVSSGDSTPGGSLYASPNDLVRFGRAILSHQQLSRTPTNRWLKPLTHTSDPLSSVGAPWEIQRYTLPNDRYRTVDLYSKSGLLGLYTAYLVLIPDYDVGFTINVAGSLSTIGPLADLMAESLVPALEEAARLQSDAKLSGTYVSTDQQYSFTLSTTMDSPGLHLSNFTGPGDSNQFATLAAASLLAAGHYEMASAVLPYFQNGSASAAYESGAFGLHLDMRLYPTLLEDSTQSQRRSFRAAIDFAESTDQFGPFLRPDITWSLLDTVQLGGKSFDKFVFILDRDGNVDSVQYDFLRQTFKRTE